MIDPTVPRWRMTRAAMRWFDAAAGAIMAALVLIVLWGVFTRFVLSAASWWTEESARLLLIWLTMLGGAAAWARAEHLGVDYFAQKLHPDAQRLVALTVELFVIAFAASVLVYGGVVLVAETLRMGQTTAALEVPMGLVYLAVPLGGAGIVLFSLERAIAAWRGPLDHHDDDTAPRAV
ncbi:TRAP transporter small permease [Botrimarina sp.]|uniref:TRAP transporter small permease n=1 Tax=Botrimarina sp. TaxID=2795802 RepID=UPI0032EBFD6D